ncbi:MAG: hemolysin III family protein [Kangiellaceae bacterium]|nr:hemolysin III family protein [Kangiellaceae bacterium]MCW9000502.1 hemolysin III family protein [Kangiellaceae bacterium]MCW9016580.1 hemolysin III family protein [Kangiellaceae bacterium]
MQSSTMDQNTYSGEYSKAEEILNTLSHALGFIVAIVGLVLMILKADGSTAITSVSIYGATLIMMFLASTCYHWVSHHRWKIVLKLFDHSAIYLLIAGTYTPLLLVSLDGWVSITGLVFIWTLAFVGVGFKIITGTRFPKVAIATYLCMGWFAIVLAYPLIQSVPSGGLWLLLAGGVLFSVGVLFYVAKHKKYTHAIWHLFVVAGCSCHFMSVYHFVI